MELLGKNKTFFLTVITILALSAFATANTCTDAYFNAQVHGVFDQESKLRIDSIFYSNSPAGWNGKKYFFIKIRLLKKL